MINFEYSRVTTVKAALEAMSKNPNAGFLAGGTNLVDLMKKSVMTPSRVIDINNLPLKEITETPNGISIGALVLNGDLAENQIVKSKYPILAMALRAGASAQVRNMATVGGNMLQRTRCTYFYDIAMPCNKRQPGSGCGAKGGFNRMHAIFGELDKCIAVHPSDMCVALAALDTTVEVSGPKGNRKIQFADFHKLAGITPEKDNNLQKGELVTGITIAQNSFAANSHYLKIRDRASYAFALVSVAAALDLTGTRINHARLAMGGVAHKPWRLKSAELFLKGKNASKENFEQAARMAIQGAVGSGHNNFKLKMAPSAIVEALMYSWQGAPR